MKTIITLFSILVFSSSFAWADLRDDINSDDRIGLAEAIHALQVATESYTGLTEAIFALQVITGHDSVLLKGKAALGPLSGAEIYLSRLDGTPIANTIAYVSDDMELAGKFTTIAQNSTLPEYFVVSAHGGIDIDPNDDGVKDLGIQSKGVIHAIVPKSIALVDSFGINPITEMIYQSIMLEHPDGVADLTDSELATLLDSKCALFLDNSTSYLNALSFVPHIDKVKSTIPWETILDKLVHPIHEGEIGSAIQGRVEMLANRLNNTGTQLTEDGVKIERLVDVGADRVLTISRSDGNGELGTIEQKYTDASGSLISTKITRLSNEYSFLEVTINKYGHSFSLEGKTTLLQGVEFTELAVNTIVDKLMTIGLSNEGSIRMSIDKSLVSKISDSEIILTIDGKEPTASELTIIMDDPVIEWYFSETEQFDSGAYVYSEVVLESEPEIKAIRLSNEMILFEMPIDKFDELTMFDIGTGIDALAGVVSLLADSSIKALGGGPVLGTISALSDISYLLSTGLPALNEAYSTSTRVGFSGRFDENKIIPGESYFPTIYLRNLRFEDNSGDLQLQGWSKYSYAEDPVWGPFSSFRVGLPQEKLGNIPLKKGYGYIIIPNMQVSFQLQAPPAGTYTSDPEISIELESNKWIAARNKNYNISRKASKYVDFNYIVNGTDINLDASACVSSDGTITSYSWKHNGTEVATGKIVTIDQSLIFDGNQDGELTLEITSFTGMTGEKIKFIEITHTGYCSVADPTQCGNETQCFSVGGCWYNNKCDKTTYEEVTSAGQVWMDRNLCASQVATSSTDPAAYGDLYQWGRLADGHQSRTSSLTSTLSPDDDPRHDSFICAPTAPYDWRTPQNDNLWQGVSGTNNPCPSGFRLPTATELEAERVSWGTSSNNSAGAFASPLKLVMAGFRSYYNGNIIYAGSDGQYWSSTVNGTYSRGLSFGDLGAYVHSGTLRAGGISVRCLKD